MQTRSFRNALLALAAGVAGLALIASGDGPAGAAVVNQNLDCGIGGKQTASLDASAPATVQQGQIYTVTLAASGPAKADGATLTNLTNSYQAPAGTTPVPGSARLLPGTGSGNLGTVTATISGNIIQAKASGPIANGATFTAPTLEFKLTATAAPGSILNVRFRQSAAYTLTASGFNVTCNATTPLTNLTSTSVTAAPTTTAGPTTTTAPLPLSTTTTTAPQPTVAFQNWSPTAGCGTVQTTTAPANTESVTITAGAGAGGRSGSQASSATVAGGAGGQATATFAATPGQTFSAVIGCNGVNGGSFSNTAQPDGYSKGGGTGRGSIIAGQAGASGGSGGGASAACLGSACKSDAIGVQPLVVAGGGGGGGVSNCAGTPSGPGGAGGAASSTANAAGAGNSGANGSGGGSSGGSSGGGAGGAGGVNSAGGGANGGANGDGSGGAGVNVVGGGGGGGFVGGSAGSNSATGCKGGGGGGGGSSWVKSGATGTSFGTATSAGVTITFRVVTPPPPPCPKDHVPFADAEKLVFHQYEDFQGRAPSIADQDLWIGGINRCEVSPDELITTLLPTSQTSLDARLVRLYWAYFKRPPDPSGFDYWRRQIEAGRGLIRAAQQFSESSEFRRTYGALSNGEFIDLVYLNVLGRQPDPSGRQFWLTRLNNGTKNRGDVMINFSESSENVRKMVDHVGVFRMFRVMRDRFPSRNEFASLIDPITAQGKTLNDAANAIRTSPAYDAIINP
jgi:hypothetical protein